MLCLPDNTGKTVATAAGLLLLAAVSSYINESFALAAGIVIILATVWRDLTAVIALSLLLVPYWNLFGLPASSLQCWLGTALVAISMRLLPVFLRQWQASDIWHSPYFRILCLFAALVILHFKTISFAELQAIGFFGITLALFFAARQASAPTGIVAPAVTAGVVVAAALSLVFLYLPLPGLILHRPPLDSLRFHGVFEGINAAARYLVAVFSYVFIRAAMPEGRRWPLLLAFLAACTVATETKSAIAAMAIVGLLTPVFLPGCRTRRIGQLFLLLIAVTTLWLAASDRVKTHALAAWSTVEDTTNAAAAFHASDESMLEKILAKLRIGWSDHLTVQESGEREHHLRPFSLWHTGLRDILWSAAADSISEHPWWGIGYKNWQPVMQEKIGFPNRSPHNGFLEVTGSYGVIGGLLYLWLAAVMLRNAWRVRKLPLSPHSAVLAWATIAGLALFWIELFDASTSLAVTPCALWFWTLLGLQEGLLAHASDAPSHQHP